jgi:hypothetical protein
VLYEHETVFDNTTEEHRVRVFENTILRIFGALKETEYNTSPGRITQGECEISGSHGGEYEDESLLGYGVV